MKIESNMQCTATEVLQPQTLPKLIPNIFFYHSNVSNDVLDLTSLHRIEPTGFSWGIPSSDGIPYGLADFFFFFFPPPPPPPSAAEYGIFGGQTQ